MNFGFILQNLDNYSVSNISIMLTRMLGVMQEKQVQILQCLIFNIITLG